MARRDLIGFLHAPDVQEPYTDIGPRNTGFFDRIPSDLPPPCQPVVVSVGHDGENSEGLESESRHSISDRKDRILYKPLAGLHGLISVSRGRYPFRRYFHRAYVRRAADIFKSSGVESIFFPLFPQWSAPLKLANPEAKLALWMPRGWLSAGPAWYERALESIDRIVCCSRFLADKVAERYPQVEDRIRLVPTGVDTKRWMPGANLSRHLLLYAGRLSPETGVHVLLKAFERLRAHYPDAQLILAGPFQVTSFSTQIELSRQERSQWQSLGRRYELQIRREAQRLGGVFFTGPLDAKAQLRIYRSASIFVYPALWSDPSGYAVLKAMACGLPVVASRCGALPEVVKDGRNGILADPGDVDQLVEAVERFFDSRDLAQRMGAASRTRTEELFDWKYAGQAVAKLAAEDMA